MTRRTINLWTERFGSAERARREGFTGRLAEVNDGEYTWVRSTRARSAVAMLRDFAATASYTGAVTLRGRIVAADGRDADSARLARKYPDREE